MQKYIDRASKRIYPWDYENFEKIIKNDRRMMKYLQCEQILSYRNDHFEVEKRAYQQCLVSYEHLKKICQKPNPSAKMQSNKEASLLSEPENKVKSEPGLDM